MRKRNLILDKIELTIDRYMSLIVLCMVFFILKYIKIFFFYIDILKSLKNIFNYIFFRINIFLKHIKI